MATRFADPPVRAADYNRSYSNDHWGRSRGRHQAYGTDATDTTRHHQPPNPSAYSAMMQTVQIPVPDPFDPYYLPAPPEGTKPPAAWDEWEMNKNWPFPPNMPMQPLRTAKDVEREKAAKAALDEEIERNANWPFPNLTRRGTTSHSAPRPRTPHRSKSRERVELRDLNASSNHATYAATQERRERRDSNSNRRHPEPQGPNAGSSHPNHAANRERRERRDSNPSRKLPEPQGPRGRRDSNAARNNQPIPPNAPRIPDPWFLQEVPPPSMNSALTTVSPLIAKDSIGLIRFDLRLPDTYARKLVQGHHWTHLNREDIKQPACVPHRTQMRVYAHSTGVNWVADVRPTSRDYVTVQDVLKAIYDTLNTPLDPAGWARDGVNPTLKDRVYRAYQKRVEKVEGVRPNGYKKARKTGLQRVDYFGSKYLFAGIMLCYGGDGSEWWQMDVMPDN